MHQQDEVVPEIGLGNSFDLICYLFLNVSICLDAISQAFEDRHFRKSSDFFPAD
jgi:hypothetical protein